MEHISEVDELSRPDTRLSADEHVNMDTEVPVATEYPAEAREIVTEFVHLVDKSKNLFNGLR